MRNVLNCESKPVLSFRLCIELLPSVLPPPHPPLHPISQGRKNKMRIPATVGLEHQQTGKQSTQHAPRQCRSRLENGCLLICREAYRYCLFSRRRVGWQWQQHFKCVQAKMSIIYHLWPMGKVSPTPHP